MDIRIERTTEAHVPLIAEALPSVIKEELEIVADKPALEGLYEAQRTGHECYVVIVEDNIVCMFGYHVKSLLNDTAYPWLIPTKWVKGKERTFAKYSKRWIEHLSTRYPTLANAVYHKNKRAIVWLKWMGFTTHPPIIFKGHEFIPYTMTRNVT